MKHIYYLFFTLLLTSGVKAQEGNVNFPTTPDSYALAKVSNYDFDHFRGQANISIPFHTINIDGVSIPVKLTYNTSGIKLNEFASSVGLGWSLNVPGSINHEIKDKNDIFFQFYSKKLSDFELMNGFVEATNINSGFRVKLGEIYDGNYDLIPDLFHYNIPNSSGSFIKNNDKGLTVPFNNDLIDINENYIKIVDSNGNSHFFSARNSIGLLNVSTTYKLDSINTFNNKKVKFHYDLSNSYSSKTITEKGHIRTLNNQEQLLDPYERFENDHGYGESLISKIETDKETVIFKYSNDENLRIGNDINRLDLTGNGYALRKIIIKNDTDIIKEFTLNYDYFTNDNSNKTPDDYRLKLINIHNNMENNFYRFDYNEVNKFPRRNTSNDDHWGYVRSLNQGLETNIPSDIRFNFEHNYDDYNRIPKRTKSINSTLSKTGILTKITYPTGGYKVFEYENPTGREERTYIGKALKVFKSFIIDTRDDNYKGELPGGGGGILEANFTNEDLYEISKDKDRSSAPYVNYQFANTCANNNGLDFNQIEPTSCYGGISSEGKNVISFDGNTSVGILKMGVITQPLNLFLSKMDIVDSRCDCSIVIDLMYDKNVYNSSSPLYPGIIVSKISTFDEKANLIDKRDFKYGRIENGTFQSIAYMDKPISYIKRSNAFKQSKDPEFESNEIEEYINVFSDSQSENSYSAIKSTYFPYVTEITNNGSVEYEFNAINNYEINSIPDYFGKDYNEWKNGILLKKKTFDRNNILLEEDIYEYNFNLARNSLSSFNSQQTDKIAFGVDLEMIRKANKSVLHGDYVYFIKKNLIFINSSTIELKRINNKQYFSNDKIIENNKLNEYSNIGLFHLKKQTTNNSKGENITTEYQYPSDLVNNPSYSALNKGFMNRLVTENRISEPVITQQKVGTISISEVHNQYDEFNGILQKSAVHQKKGNGINIDAVVDRKIKYDSYDDKGNLTQYTPENGIPVAIIWGYNGQYPVAKIEGATYLEVSNYVSALQATSLTKDSFKALRDNFPLAMVTGYVYKPLVGVTEIVQPNGQVEFYEYDSANRLKSIKNSQGEVLKTFEYHYTNTNEEIIKYYNEAINFTVYKQCGDNQKSDPITYTIPAGKYSSTVSIADANTKARNSEQQAGQDHANNIGVCKNIYYNQEISYEVNKQCGSNQISDPIIYTIPAGKYSSTVSVSNANNIAKNSEQQAGQDYANNTGVCKNIYYNQEISYEVNKQCSDNLRADPVIYTIPAKKYSSVVSVSDANNIALNSEQQAGQDYANSIGICVLPDSPELIFPNEL